MDPQKILVEAVACEEVVTVGEICDCIIETFKALHNNTPMFKDIPDNVSIDLMLSILITIMSNFGKSDKKYMA